jgi:hypothetical protein
LCRADAISSIARSNTFDQTSYPSTGGSDKPVSVIDVPLETGGEVGCDA